MKRAPTGPKYNPNDGKHRNPYFKQGYQPRPLQLYPSWPAVHRADSYRYTGDSKYGHNYRPRYPDGPKLSPGQGSRLSYPLDYSHTLADDGGKHSQATYPESHRDSQASKSAGELSEEGEIRSSRRAEYESPRFRKDLRPGTSNEGNRRRDQEWKQNFKDSESYSDGRRDQEWRKNSKEVEGYADHHRDQEWKQKPREAESYSDGRSRGYTRDDQNKRDRTRQNYSARNLSRDIDGLLEDGYRSTRSNRSSVSAEPRTPAPVTPKTTRSRTYDAGGYGHRYEWQPSALPKHRSGSNNPPRRKRSSRSRSPPVATADTKKLRTQPVQSEYSVHATGTFRFKDKFGGSSRAHGRHIDGHEEVQVPYSRETNTRYGVKVHNTEDKSSTPRTNRAPLESFEFKLPHLEFDRKLRDQRFESFDRPPPSQDSRHRKYQPFDDRSQFSSKARRPRLTSASPPKTPNFNPPYTSRQNPSRSERQSSPDYFNNKYSTHKQQPESIATSSHDVRSARVIPDSTHLLMAAQECLSLSEVCGHSLLVAKSTKLLGFQELSTAEPLHEPIDTSTEIYSSCDNSPSYQRGIRRIGLPSERKILVLKLTTKSQNNVPLSIPDSPILKGSRTDTEAGGEPLGADSTVAQEEESEPTSVPRLHIISPSPPLVKPESMDKRAATSTKVSETHLKVPTSGREWVIPRENTADRYTASAAAEEATPFDGAAGMSSDLSDLDSEYDPDYENHTNSDSSISHGISTTFDSSIDPDIPIASEMPVPNSHEEELGSDTVFPSHVTEGKPYYQVPGNAHKFYIMPTDMNGWLDAAEQFLPSTVYYNLMRILREWNQRLYVGLPPHFYFSLTTYV